MKDEKSKGLMEQEFEVGTKGYVLQKYYMECQEIGKKYEPIMRAIPGLLDYAPYAIEIKTAQKRVTQELKRIAREEEAIKLNAKQQSEENEP